MSDELARLERCQYCHHVFYTDGQIYRNYTCDKCNNLLTDIVKKAVEHAKKDMDK